MTVAIRFEPERFAKAYIDWMENIRDWCISRQIWWGHRIPVWYCDNGHVFASLEDPGCVRGVRIDETHTGRRRPRHLVLVPAVAVLDAGLAGRDADLATFYPTTLMVTGYEILYLWVARMIMSGLYFMKDIPFEDVFIHGIVRDNSGKKMSKSLGNVIDPLDMIERYRRRRTALLAGLLRDVGQRLERFSEDRIEEGPQLRQQAVECGPLRAHLVGR